MMLSLNLLLAAAIHLSLASGSEKDDGVKTQALCGPSFRYFGMSEAGAEMNNNRIPGNEGQDYAWPTAASADYFLSRGMNTIRIPFAMERLNNNGGLNNGFNTDYFQRLRGAVGYVTSKGAYAVLDAHNSFRYNGRQINNNNEFQNFWNRLAGEFRNDPRVIFEVMNSPDGVSASQAADLNQAAINGIRNAGATSQLIIVEGSQRSLAAGWNNSGNANAFNRIRDPNNNFAIGFRTFFDQDGSGREASCFSASVGADRLKVATDWLNNQRFKGFLVEFGAGPNTACSNTVASALCHMQGSNAWLGATYWAAGPMWGSNFGSMEPPNGPGLNEILTKGLLPFL